MITKERFHELLLEAGLDEKKFHQLMLKEDSSFTELKDSDLDHVTGGEGWWDEFVIAIAKYGAGIR